MLDLIQFMQEWLLELLGGYSQKVLITNLILLVFTIFVYWWFMCWYSVDSGRFPAGY